LETLLSRRVTAPRLFFRTNKLKNQFFVGPFTPVFPPVLRGSPSIPGFVSPCVLSKEGNFTSPLLKTTFYSRFHGLGIVSLMRILPILLEEKTGLHPAGAPTFLSATNISELSVPPPFPAPVSPGTWRFPLLQLAGREDYFPTPPR